MSATPADIAKFTSDGVLITSPTDPAVSAAIKALHPDARDSSTSEIEMFFDSATDAQTFADERFAFLSESNPVHVGVEIEDAAGAGFIGSVVQTVPCYTVIDEGLGISQNCRLRAYSYELGTDRFSLELLG